MLISKYKIKKTKYKNKISIQYLAYLLNLDRIVNSLQTLLVQISHFPLLNNQDLAGGLWVINVSLKGFTNYSQSLLQSHIVLVAFFQELDNGFGALSNRIGFVVSDNSRGIHLMQLCLSIAVDSGNHYGESQRPATSLLCVSLHDFRSSFAQIIYSRNLVKGLSEGLTGGSQGSNQLSCISRKSRESASNVLINKTDLLHGCVFLQFLGSFLFGSQKYKVLSLKSNRVVSLISLLV